MTEQIRAVSRHRLLEPWGAVDAETLRQVDRRLLVVLDLV
jgi:mRNA-degrading endonuclease toxin of MazEF toxin-antitoxin module